MTVEERIGAADQRKMDGNAFFKEEKLEEAMQQYEMVTFFHIPEYFVPASYFYRFTPPPPKFLRAIVCVGHSLYGRRLHVPVVWEVPGYGFGC